MEVQVIEILESDDEGCGVAVGCVAVGGVAGGVKFQSRLTRIDPRSLGTGERKRKRRRTATDDEVQVVENEVKLQVDKEGDEFGGDSEEIQVIGTTGLSVSDLPHAREHCVRHPLKKTTSKESYCSKCMCFVCQVYVKDCSEWDRHWRATGTERKWKKMQIQYKERQNATGGTSAQAPSQNHTHRAQYQTPEPGVSYTQAIPELQLDEMCECGCGYEGWSYSDLEDTFEDYV
mmetsp:Transcript_9204/g.17388  ORF Transcript_9204/g.17388 Transcript_9204/m.17388 type:complete len:232 (-) Transcript_9204:369-1064(-)